MLLVLIDGLYKKLGKADIAKELNIYLQRVLKEASYKTSSMSECHINLCRGIHWVLFPYAKLYRNATDRHP